MLLSYYDTIKYNNDELLSIKIKPTNISSNNRRGNSNKNIVIEMYIIYIIIIIA